MSEFLLMAQVLFFLLLATRLSAGLVRSHTIPVNILADVVAKIISRHWITLRPQLNELARDPMQLKYLQIAQEYLNRRSAGVYKLEMEHSVSRAQETFLRDESRRNTDTVSDIIWVTLLVVAVVAVLTGVLWFILFLAQERPILSILTAVGVAFLIWLVTRPSSPALEYVPEIGSASAWDHYQPRSSREYDAERQQIFMAIVNTGAGIGETGEQQDTDLEISTETSLPAPPGITELVLSSTNQSLEEIREELLALKRWHKLVFIGIFSLFITVVVGNIIASYVLFSGSPNATNATLGGIGLAAIIGGMLWGFLPSLRTSHIAIALYRSYQVELAAALAAASSASPDERRQLEAQAWDRFRTGLNGLWLQENRTRSALTSMFRGRSEDETKKT